MGVLPNYSSVAQQKPYLPTVSAAVNSTPGQQTQASSTGKSSQPVVDEAKWRTTGLRYLGYADEVGAFLEPYLAGAGKFLGYFISALYCGADMISTGKLLNKHEQVPSGERHKKVSLELLTLGTFHFIATLLVPPWLISTGVEWLDDKLNGNKEKGTAGKLSNLKNKEWAKNAFNEKRVEWANSKLYPGVKHVGDATAAMFKPLQWMVHKMPFIGNKHIPFFGHFLANIDEEIGKLRNIPRFRQKDLIRLAFQKPLPVLAGIAMVPLIAHPFDKLTEFVLDWTLRPMFGINKLTKGLDGKQRSEKNKAFWNPKTEQQKGTTLPTPIAAQAPPAPVQTAMVATPLVAATQVPGPFQQWVHNDFPRALRREEAALLHQLRS